MGTRVPIGVAVWPEPGVTNDVADVIDQVTAARAAGVASVWFGQRFDLDSLVLAGVVAQAVPDIGVGTSVVPINPRHPIVVASQAQTVQAAAHGRFRLGLGLGAAAREEAAYGLREPKPIQRLREYLTALRQLIEDGGAAVDGERLRAHPAGPTTVQGGQGIPLLVAALGPQALRVTGELADGVLPFLTGPHTLESHVLPSLQRARPQQAPPPQVVAGVVALVTDRPDEIRARAVDALAFYESIPSYRAALDREKVTRAADLALIGDEEQVAAGLRAYAAAGATEIWVSRSGLGTTAEYHRTTTLLGELSA
ncbi:TIGR03564 family F420-dependent LLM class oxidoreductase [Nocardia sp. alder85J]|uniref:TIGR03564 family F420-dependent LLM class oxidoreductase n=1 Tax=Nocardia sp. alder85J TaxID=2862949 RepID=UPI001CD1FB8C|nr:TIGR03564 family F420-dependent LLM class oxidoreductase [Nocardia sp. alder85J]MCX4095463.1 TIGR03564 family F420-dependent LLM class oxidoreductase [Nocardia sp. alder85J]